jgi:hypothetical protein
MARLQACPFCRALYGPNDGARCPECDVELVPMDKLALSDEARALDEFEVPLEDRPFAWNDFGRGRGVLLALSALGLAAFFCPWVMLLLPEDMVLRGFDLARGRAGWLWGGATGFFVLLPLLWTRRTISRLRGARVIATLFASMTCFEVLVLLLFPPRRGLIPLELRWQWGLYASAAISAAATYFAVRLGGPLPLQPSPDPAPSKTATPDDRVLH